MDRFLDLLIRRREVESRCLLFRYTGEDTENRRHKVGPLYAEFRLIEALVFSNRIRMMLAPACSGNLPIGRWKWAVSCYRRRPVVFSRRIGMSASSGKAEEVSWHRITLSEPAPASSLTARDMSCAASETNRPRGVGRQSCN